jgi:hypothetical protein
VTAVDGDSLTYSRGVLVGVIMYHQREDITRCYCGWADLGKSHASHVADVYEQCIAEVQNG